MSKIALITGGSRGLGKEMATQIAAKGNDVIITYNNNKEKAQDVITKIGSMGQKAAALQLDVSRPESLNVFMDSLKEILTNVFQANNIDYLVNNAGIGIYKPFEETQEADIDLLFNIHYKSVFMMTQNILPIINKGGAILNVSSGLARFSLPGYAAYGAMKGAVETLTKYQAKEFGPKGIRVNVLAPGAIETDFGGGAVRDNADLNNFVASQTALGRAGLPDDIGTVAAFLCSDDAKWITGQRIEASGGMIL